MSKGKIESQLLSSNPNAGMFGARWVNPLPLASFSQVSRDGSSGQVSSLGRGGALNAVAQAGQVARTLVLANNTLIPGNFASANGHGPRAVAFDSWNENLYVVNGGYFPGDPASDIAVIDGTTNQLVASIPVEHDPMGIVFDSWNGFLYLTHLFSDNITVIDGSTNRVVASITGATQGAIGVAFDSRNGNVYVANYYTWVTVINGSTDAVVATIPAAGYGSYLGGIAFDSSNGDL